MFQIFMKHSRQHSQHRKLADPFLMVKLGICFAQWQELCEERLRAIIPGVDGLFHVKPLFRLPQQGEGKQTKLDGIGGDPPYDYGVAEPRKILQMCVDVLIWLATERSNLHHVDDAGLELKIHIPNIDAGSSSHIGDGGDGKLTKSLLIHSFKYDWCLKNGFLCRENSRRRDDARSCPSHVLL